jgi:hypothetical protein
MQDELTPKILPDLDTAEKKILEIGVQIKAARQLGVFKCAQGNGCFACKPFEAIVRREAQFVGIDEYNTDVYVLRNAPADDENESYIL